MGISGYPGLSGGRQSLQDRNHRGADRFVLRGCVRVDREVTDLVHGPLLLPDIPVETLGQRVEPVSDLVLEREGDGDGRW